MTAAPALPDVKVIAGLRGRLLGWLDDAKSAGLTEDMVSALFSAVLRDHAEVPWAPAACLAESGGAAAGGAA